MAIPSWQCPDLGHLALTMASTADFTAANDDIPFVIPVQPTDPTTALPGPTPIGLPAPVPLSAVAGQVPALGLNPAVTGQFPTPLHHFTVLERQCLYIAKKEAFYTSKVTKKALRTQWSTNTSTT